MYMYRYSLHWPSVCNRSCCRLWRSLWDRWPLRRGNKKKKKENGISNEVTTLCNTEQHNQRGGSATTAAPELNGVVMETTIDSRFFVFWKREPICKYPRNTHPSGGSFFSGPDTIPRHVLRRLATFSGCCAYYCVSQVAKGAAVPLLD